MDDHLRFSDKALRRVMSRAEIAARYVPENLLSAAAVQLITEDVGAMAGEIRRLRGIEEFSDRVVEFVRRRGLAGELTRFLNAAEGGVERNPAAAGD